jgi:hypothetical protein
MARVIPILQGTMTAMLSWRVDVVRSTKCLHILLPVFLMVQIISNPCGVYGERQGEIFMYLM